VMMVVEGCIRTERERKIRDVEEDEEKGQGSVEVEKG